MTNLDIAIAAHTAAEVAFDAACQRFTNAQRALKRSKSAANKAEFIASRDAHEVASEACRLAQGQVERAETVARRLALVAPRRAARTTQGDLFA